MHLVASGFLPTRGSWVLDTVFLGMFLICLLMTISIGRVRYKRQFQTHKNLQLGLAGFLVVAITVFEIDIRFITDWRQLAEASEFYSNGTVDFALLIHLCFAIPTPFLWGFVVFSAIRKFPHPPRPGRHSHSHRIWGRVAAAMMGMTAITGCIFYWLAFAC
jgi:putative membrane protein